MSAVDAMGFCLLFLLLFLFDVDLRLRVWIVSLQRDLGLVTCRKENNSDMAFFIKNV